MRIYFDTVTADGPEKGRVRFHHEAILGSREIPGEQSPKEIKAGKRPVMIPNPACRIPDDAMLISDARFDELMTEQAAGKVIVMRRGKPVAINPETDPAELREMRRRKRDRLLAQSDWTQLPDALLDDAALKADWALYRGELRDLNMDGSDWPVSPAEENDEESD